jgi:glycosyltransferase involved in cell wall biosynthesis
MNPRRRLLFCSWQAFDPTTWAVLEELVRVHRFSATVLAPPKVCVGRIYSPTGYLTPELVDLSGVDSRLPPLLDDNTPVDGFKPEALRSALAGLRPDSIWIHGEPTDGLTRQILKHFYFRRRIRIACFLAENLWQRPPLLQRIKAQILCLRINALLAAGSASGVSVHKAFMPRCVKSYTLFMPNLDPRTAELGDYYIPRQSGEFFLGFVGKISREKGWQVMIDALTKLSDNVKAVIAGDGPDVTMLQREVLSRGIERRLIFAGPLAAPDIRAIYRQVDVVVVPSLSTSRWMEQFGRVIAEAMAAGRPVVGSTSGAIPEVVDDAGLLVKEGDATALADVLRTLQEDHVLRDRLGTLARRRFEREFTVETYARRLAGILLKDA